MSSLANAIKRRTHKERAQPAKRRKYGLLEKHKDYVLRAKDFHRKEKTIKLLKRKAEERNPDEFYFAMEKARTKGGVHVAPTAEANKYSQEELRLMKSQDVNYLTLKSRSEAEKVARLQRSHHFIGLAPQNSHTVFVDSAAEAKALQPEEFFDTAPELLGRAFNRPRRAQLASASATSATVPPALAAKLERHKLAAYKELAQRSDRQAKLAGLAAKLAMDKEVMGRGRKRKLSKAEVGDAAGGAPGMKHFRWKQERKR